MDQDFIKNYSLLDRFNVSRETCLDFERLISMIKSKNEKKIVPNFLIDKDLLEKDTNTLLKGIRLIDEFLEKNILKPNNISYPISRAHFIDSLK